MSRPRPTRRSPGALSRRLPSTRAKARPICSARSPSISSPSSPRMSYALKIPEGVLSGMRAQDTCRILRRRARRGAAGAGPADQGRRQGGRRHAGAERGTHAASHVGRHPGGLGRRGDPRRRQVERRHRRTRPRAAAAPRLASPQRRLRRQPEDLLPGGAAAERGVGDPPAPRRPVRAGHHPEAGRADRAGGGRRRARLALPHAGRGTRGGDAAVALRAEPVPDHRGEQGHADGAVRAAHGLPRVLAAGAARGAVAAQLARLLLRLRAAHAGGPLRLPLPRGAVRDALLQGRLLRLVPPGRGLRGQDAARGGAARAAPPRDLAVAQVPALTGRQPARRGGRTRLPLMAGHSKWAGIKHKKAIVDARRGKLFTKLARAITVAAKEGGGDVEGNPALALAVQKAKDASMPKDNIERAIAKGTGEGADADALEAVMYEGYGPGGVAVLVEALTDNRNRTGSEIRHIFAKGGGSLGEPGSVAYNFDKKGTIVVDGERYTEDDLMVAIDAGAEDIALDEDVFEITSEPADLTAVRSALDEAGIEVESAEVAQLPKSRVPLEEDVAVKLMRLIDALEDQDDVDAVHANFDVDAEVLERVAG